MSTASRLISASAASWIRIGITMSAQLLLVPLYLKFWGVEPYGIWLAIQALVNLMTLIDMGHQNYLGYEFLKYGKKNVLELSRFLSSGITFAIGIGLLQLLIILAFMFTGALPFLLDKADLHESSLIDQAGIVFFAQGLGWFLTSTIGGLFIRALESFGYYARLAWWGVFTNVAVNIVPAIAVIYGADFLWTGIITAVTTVVFYIPIYWDMFRLMRKEGIRFLKPSLKLGLRNFLHSTAVAGKVILENARQQGIRIVLTPLAGPVGLAAFSTMRTGSNVALQGLNTVTNPLMPDLMRFLHDRDQVRAEGAFGTVWTVVVLALAPGVVILQAVIAPLFAIWTQGKIHFDPTLFATLSLSVLVYAIVQPAMAVVLGNNLIKEQLAVSIAGAVVVIGGVIILVPMIGIVGASIALLAAEIVAGAGYIYYAKRWLRQNALHWPSRTFWTCSTSVFITAISIGFIIVLHQSIPIIVGISLFLLGWNLWRFWVVLPAIVRQRIRQLVGNLPVVRTRLSKS